MFQVCDTNMIKVFSLLVVSNKTSCQQAFSLRPKSLCVSLSALYCVETIEPVPYQGHHMNKAVCLCLSGQRWKLAGILWLGTGLCFCLWLPICKSHNLSPSPSLPSKEQSAQFSLNTWNFASSIYKGIWDQPTGDGVEEIQCENTGNLLAQLVRKIPLNCFKQAQN